MKTFVVSYLAGKLDLRLEMHRRFQETGPALSIGPEGGNQAPIGQLPTDFSPLATPGHGRCGFEWH